MSDVLAVTTPLAKSGEALKSGPIGLAIILILCIACYFLFKSMSKHLKTVREDFPTDPGPAETAEAKPQPSVDAQPSAPAQTNLQAPASPGPTDQPVADPPERAS